MNNQTPNTKHQTPNTKRIRFGKLVIGNWLLFGYWLLVIGVYSVYAQEGKIEPITINGDTIEYATDKNEATVTGNVEVIYKGTKLTCDKLVMNRETKDAEAFGHARLDDVKGTVEGEKIVYNFDTHSGVIVDSQFRANPYFGRAEKTKRVSEDEFIAMRGYFTTCSYDNPHYRIKSKKINLFPGDKIQTRDDVFYLGRLPVAYIPQYSHSLRDPLMHVQLMPGKSKDWGPYMLTAWRTNINDNVRGRIYFDYREKLGVSEGFGINYTTDDFGKGDYKYYYMQERSRWFDEGVPAEFQRYFIRWRHKWDVDERTNMNIQYYKIVDSKMVLHGSQYNILKDYFPREYEKDPQPLSYTTYHHDFNYSSLDLLLQKRTNRWYSQDEKLPEIKYSLPSHKIGESPFYFQNNTSYISFNNKNAVPSPSWDDVAYNKVDTSNSFSLPKRVSFISVTPFISAQEIFNDKGTYGSTWNNNLATGADLSTKFYRIFNVNSNLLGMDINGLRHIITPTATYTYGKNTTTPFRNPRFGGYYTTPNSSVALELSNKLQTKRKSQSVDLADVKANTNYLINPKTGEKLGSNFSDFLFEAKLLPYSWLRIDGDATYKHSGARSEANYKHFSEANYDINFDFAEERTFGIGQRYYRKGGNELTHNMKWRLNPKWKLSFYQKRSFSHVPGVKRGLREQEYTISRDLHCWTVDFTYNVRRGAGESIWFIFRLKAFPELEFDYNKSYNAPKPGSQSNP